MDHLTLISDMEYETQIDFHCADNCNTYDGTEFLGIISERLHSDYDSVFIKRELQPDSIEVEESDIYNACTDVEVSAVKNLVSVKEEILDYVIVKTESSSESGEHQNISREGEDSLQDAATDRFELPVKLEEYSPHCMQGERLLRSSSDSVVTFEDTKVSLTINGTDEKSEHSQDPLSTATVFEEQMQLLWSKRRRQGKHTTKDEAHKRYKNTLAPAKSSECNVPDNSFPTNTQDLKIQARLWAGHKSFKCYLCDFKSSRRENLIVHIRTHTGEKPFKCSICDFKCSRSENLKRHTRTHQKPVNCDGCDYECTQAEHAHTCAEEKRFKCSICKYKCSRSAHLKQHMRTHTGEKPFECTICDYKCAYLVNLKSHIRTHTGEKLSKCTVCDYRCSNTSSLKRHMCTHTGEKRFVCGFCEYRSSSSRNLKEHMYSHTGEAPFKCIVCDYKCTRSDTLRRHMCMHTGEKHFKCNVCDYSCSQASNLKRHTHTHSAVKPLKCEVSVVSNAFGR